MAALSEQQVADAKSKSETAVKVTINPSGSEPVEVMVRRPTRAEWKAYRTAALSDDAGKKSSAGEQLFMQCAVVPSKSDGALMPLLESYPAIVESVVPVLSSMAGFDAKAQADF